MSLTTLSTADLLELIAAYRARTSLAIALKKAAEDAQALKALEPLTKRTWPRRRETIRICASSWKSVQRSKRME
jgi:hypothetical protein